MTDTGVNKAGIKPSESTATFQPTMTDKKACTRQVDGKKITTCLVFTPCWARIKLVLSNHSQTEKTLQHASLAEAPEARFRHT